MYIDQDPNLRNRKKTNNFLNQKRLMSVIALFATNSSSVDSQNSLGNQKNLPLFTLISPSLVSTGLATNITYPPDTLQGYNFDVNQTQATITLPLSLRFADNSALRRECFIVYLVSDPAGLIGLNQGAYSPREFLAAVTATRQAGRSVLVYSSLLGLSLSANQTYTFSSDHSVPSTADALRVRFISYASAEAYKYGVRVGDREEQIIVCQELRSLGVFAHVVNSNILIGSVPSRTTNGNIKEYLASTPQPVTDLQYLRSGAALGYLDGSLVRNHADFGKTCANAQCVIYPFRSNFCDGCDVHDLNLTDFSVGDYYSLVLSESSDLFGLVQQPTLTLGGSSTFLFASAGADAFTAALPDVLLKRNVIFNARVKTATGFLSQFGRPGSFTHADSSASSLIGFRTRKSGGTFTANAVVEVPSSSTTNLEDLDRQTSIETESLGGGGSRLFTFVCKFSALGSIIYAAYPYKMSKARLGLQNDGAVMLTQSQNTFYLNLSSTAVTQFVSLSMGGGYPSNSTIPNVSCVFFLTCGENERKNNVMTVRNLDSLLYTIGSTFYNDRAPSAFEIDYGQTFDTGNEIIVGRRTLYQRPRRDDYQWSLSIYGNQFSATLKLCILRIGEDIFFFEQEFLNGEIAFELATDSSGTNLFFRSLYSSFCTKLGRCGAGTSFLNILLGLNFGTSMTLDKNFLTDRATVGVGDFGTKLAVTTSFAFTKSYSKNFSYQSFFYYMITSFLYDPTNTADTLFDYLVPMGKTNPAILGYHLLPNLYYCDTLVISASRSCSNLLPENHGHKIVLQKVLRNSKVGPDILPTLKQLKNCIVIERRPSEQGNEMVMVSTNGKSVTFPLRQISKVDFYFVVSDAFVSLFADKSNVLNIPRVDWQDFNTDNKYVEGFYLWFYNPYAKSMLRQGLVRLMRNTANCTAFRAWPSSDYNLGISCGVNYGNYARTVPLPNDSVYKFNPLNTITLTSGSNLNSIWGKSYNGSLSGVWRFIITLERSGSYSMQNLIDNFNSNAFVGVLFTDSVTSFSGAAGDLRVGSTAYPSSTVASNSDFNTGNNVTQPIESRSGNPGIAPVFPMSKVFWAATNPSTSSTWLMRAGSHLYYGRQNASGPPVNSDLLTNQTNGDFPGSSFLNPQMADDTDSTNPTGRVSFCALEFRTVQFADGTLAHDFGDSTNLFSTNYSDTFSTSICRPFAIWNCVGPSSGSASITFEWEFSQPSSTAGWFKDMPLATAAYSSPNKQNQNYYTSQQVVQDYLPSLTNLKYFN